MPAPQKFTPEIDGALRNVIASQRLVRTEVMDAFEQSVAANRDLLDRLAK